MFLDCPRLALTLSPVFADFLTLLTGYELHTTLLPALLGDLLPFKGFYGATHYNTTVFKRDPFSPYITRRIASSEIMSDIGREMQPKYGWTMKT
jgi:hypothetical protein